MNKHLPSASPMAGKRPTPKAQHSIPRLHLKHFAGQQPKGQVWTYDKATGKARSAVPEETAVFTHFYSVELDDGTYDTRIEEFLSTIETKAGPIYEELIADKFPDSDQKRADFALFVALLYLRTPAMRRDAANMIGRWIQITNYAYGVHDGAFDGLTRRIEKERGEPISPVVQEKFRQMLIDPSNYTLRIPKEQTFTSFRTADKLAPILFRMNWSIVRPRHGYFISSDNPVTRFVDPKTSHPIYGDHGFLNKTAEVTLPLTPQAILLMTWRGDVPPNAVIELAHVRHMNRQRAIFADQFLYAHLSDKRLQRLATDFKDSRPITTTDGFGPDKFGDIEVPRRWK
jgi:hypothetical protein